MSTYIFILGKDRDLSIAEINSVFDNPTTIALGGDYYIIETEIQINQHILDLMGGVIKVAKVISISSKDSLLNTIFVHLKSRHQGSKLNYGVSLYGISQRDLKTILISLKKKFREESISTRFANQQFLNISTAQYKGLSKKGIEIIVARNGDEYVISETIGVQDIDSYSKRDFDKPFRDMKVGMLPPKLAQIMINLSGKPEVIWDPFCGGGVLVMEGLLMGHDMMGSDINERTLKGAERNVDWLNREFKVNGRSDLFVHDATTPLSDPEFDAIVFEGYLGPPQSGVHSKQSLLPIIKELDKLYTNFFKSVKKMNFKGPIIVGLPFFKSEDGELDLSLTIVTIKALGFKLSLGPIKYVRPNQIVGRVIYRLELN